MERSVPGNGATDETGNRRVPEHGTLGLSDTAWAEALRRAAVIGPLAARGTAPAVAARAAARALGLSERTVYHYLGIL